MDAKSALVLPLLGRCSSLPGHGQQDKPARDGRVVLHGVTGDW
jgi:hypothetical protein